MQNNIVEEPKTGGREPETGNQEQRIPEDQKQEKLRPGEPESG